MDPDPAGQIKPLDPDSHASPTLFMNIFFFDTPPKLANYPFYGNHQCLCNLTGRQFILHSAILAFHNFQRRGQT